MLNDPARRAIIRALWLEYGVSTKIFILDNYLFQRLGSDLIEEDFERILREDPKLYQAVLEYFFMEDKPQTIFYPGMMGFLEGLAIILQQKLVVWRVNRVKQELEIQYKNIDYIDESPDIMHLLLENGHFNFLKFQLTTDPRIEEDFFSGQESKDLLAAIQSGNIDEVSRLMHGRRASDILDLDFGRAPLHCAAIAGQEAIVRLLLDEFSADPNSRDNNGQTALHFAASRGYPAIVRLLVNDYKVNVDQPDNRGQIALHFAAGKGRMALVTLLIKELGANRNQGDYEGQTALHFAAHWGQEEMARLLVNDFEVDIDQMDFRGQAALHFAANIGQTNMVRLLLGVLRADKNKKDYRGQTALHHAANQGRIDIVRLLVEEFEVNVNQRDDRGQTALHHAASRGQVKVINLLVEDLGVPVEQEDNRGQTALYFAADGGSLEAISELVRLNGPVPPLDKLRILALAIQRRQEVVVRYLLEEAKLLPNLLDLKTWQLLRKAIARNSAQERQLQERFAGEDIPFGSEGNTIIEHFESKLRRAINIEDPESKRLLQEAVAVGDVEVVKMLLEIFPINTVFEEGLPLLHIAAMNGSLELVQLLVQRGSDIHQIHPNTGLSPLGYAVRDNRIAIVEFLLTHFRDEITPRELNAALELAAFYRRGAQQVVRLEIGRLLMEAGADLQIIAEPTNNLYRWLRKEFTP